jgi:hypothetical protein
MIKPKSMIWGEYIAVMREKRKAYRIVVEKPEERDH